MESVPQVRVRRGPKKGHYDGDTIRRVLERGLIAHVAFADGDVTYCIPMLYAWTGGRLYVHGSRASRLVRRLAAGAEACLTVTLLDGLVLARSVFEHSVNYESAMLFGRFEAVIDDAERLQALEAFTEALLPGRWGEARPPDARELKATAILRMTVEACSAKLRSGPPDDDDSPDAERAVWAGTIPIAVAYGSPIPSPGLRSGLSVSPSVRRLLAERP